MNTRNKWKTKCGIFIFSLITQSMNALSLMLSGITADYPNVGTSSVQIVFTLITLASVAGTVAAGKLACLMTKKKMVSIFMVIMVFGGIFGRFLGNSLGMLYVASIIIGVSNGVLIPAGSALIAEHFEGEERAACVGLQSLFVSGGGMLLNMLAGMLAAVYWKNTYLVLLTSIPVLVFTILLLPEGKIEQSEKNEKAPVLNTFLVTLILHSLLFGICWMTFYTNLTYYVFELGVGNETQAGYVTMLFSAGSIIVGLILNRVMKVTGKYCFATGLFISAAGFWIFSVASGLPILMIGAVMQGIGFGLFMPSGYAIIPNYVHSGAITMGIALFTAAMSLGGFVNPYVVTPIAGIMSTAVSARFFIAAILQTINAVVCIFTTRVIMK